MSDVSTPCFFNGNDLKAVSNLTVLATNPYVPGQRKLNISELVRTNKSKATSAFYTNKTIAVRVSIRAATRALLESSIDSLMLILSGVEKELVLSQSGAMRKYYATFTGATIHKEGGSFIEMTLSFVCSDRFGYDLQPTLAGTITYNPTITLSFAGSAEWQAPVIQITYTALTNGTSATVSVGNQATGATVSITRNWAAGDVIEIDCYNATVKVNGVEVAFSGALPYFAPGTGVLTYADNFSSRTMAGSVRYNARYV